MDLERIEKLIFSKNEADQEIGVRVLYLTLGEDEFVKYFHNRNVNYDNIYTAVIDTPNYCIFPIPHKYQAKRIGDKEYRGYGGHTKIDLR